MSVIDILTVVNSEMVANGSLPPASTLNFGPSPRGVKASPPFIFWNPREEGDSFDLTAPAIRQVDVAAWYAANPGKQIPRQLHTRWAGIGVHIWATQAAQQGAASTDDYRATEALLGAVISAVHHATYGAYRVTGGGMIREGTDAAALGHKYLLHLQIAVPVLEVQEGATATEVQTILTSQQTDQIGPLPPGGTVWSTTP